MENQSLEITNHVPASLLMLPGEILTKIMSFAMASDTPVFLWVFRNLSLSYCPYDWLNQRAATKRFWSDHTILQSQQQHLQDWISVTGTCRRLRECGIPAFFREKSFVVPPGMLRDLLDGKIRSSNFDMAMECIHKVVVPLNTGVDGMEFLILPEYHRFTRLSAMTIQAGDSPNRILDERRQDRPWPQETPEELHDLLRQLGLEIDITKLKLVVMVKKESSARVCMRFMKQEVYPFLRMMIELRTKPGVAPP